MSDHLQAKYNPYMGSVGQPAPPEFVSRVPPDRASAVETAECFNPELAYGPCPVHGLYHDAEKPCFYCLCENFDAKTKG